MIKKSNILKAIQEGILAGFKFASKNTVDDSSYVNFKDSEIDGVESYNIKLINKEFAQFIENKDWENVLIYVDTYGTKILTARYDISNFSHAQLISFINLLIKSFGSNINLNWLDVSNISNMTNLFFKSKFNGDISEWDTSNVVDMDSMFEKSSFNGDIANWNVSNVINMSYMFDHSAFNSDISNWDVSNVKNMCSMFFKSPFDKDISSWDVSNVENMYGMFAHSPFNKDISKWDVSNVTHMRGMFADSKFNQDISLWDVSSVTDMSSMFYMNKIFNLNLSAWDISNVIDMNSMFCDSNFNSDISNWNISVGCDNKNMFENCLIEKRFKPVCLRTNNHLQENTKTSFKFASNNITNDINFEDSKINKISSLTMSSLFEERDFADLGLSVKWAKFNIGATCQDALDSWYGNYYAWGETIIKDNYFNTYNQTLYEKYNQDHFTVLLSEDDIVTQTYHKLEKFRMPTKEEYQELLNNCVVEYVENYDGIQSLCGYVLTSAINQNFIFIPAAGFKSQSEISHDIFGARLWSKTLKLDDCNDAYRIKFNASFNEIDAMARRCGLPVRGVCEK